MAYVVEKGDTISKVTDLLNVSWAELKKANTHAVGRASKTGNWFLKQGAVIEGKSAFESVLKQTQKPAVETSYQKAPKNDSRDFKEYTIKRGDTLWALATKKFHVNVKDLIEANGIENPKRLQPGRKLRVPILSHPEEQTVVASWYGEAYHNRSHGKRRLI